MEEFSAKLYDLVREGEEIAVVTVINTSGSTPRKVGSKMIVDIAGSVRWGTIGGGNIEYLATQAAVKAITAGKPEMIDYSLDGTTSDSSTVNNQKDTGMICGGNMSVFIDVSPRSDNLYIIGSGHIARELCPLAKKSGFSVTVIDDREGTATKEYFPDARELITGDFKSSIDDISFKPGNFIVIVTYSHSADEAALETVLRKESSDWTYLGMISSKRKASEIKGRLQQKGIDERLLNRVNAPIGLFKAQRPYDIAISILGEIIQTREQKK